MPIPKTVAKLNRVGINHLTRRFAPWTPGFGVVIHTGRRSGRTFRTPVNVFRSSGGYVIALTYGADSDWVKNVLAADGCELATRGRTVKLASPHIFHDETQHDVSAVARPILRLLRVDDFLALTAQPY